MGVSSAGLRHRVSRLWVSSNISKAQWTQKESLCCTCHADSWALEEHSVIRIQTEKKEQGQGVPEACDLSQIFSWAHPVLQLLFFYSLRFRHAGAKGIAGVTSVSSATGIIPDKWTVWRKLDKFHDTNQSIVNIICNEVLLMSLLDVQCLHNQWNGFEHKLAKTRKFMTVNGDHWRLGKCFSFL